MVTKRQMANIEDYAFGPNNDESIKTFMEEEEIKLYKSLIAKYDIDMYNKYLLREFILGEDKYFCCPIGDRTRVLSLKRNEKGEIVEW